VALVAEADSLEALNKIWKRREWRYRITCNSMPIDEKGFPILLLPDQDLTEGE
jgi:hypothetical protein